MIGPAAKRRRGRLKPHGRSARGSGQRGRDDSSGERFGREGQVREQGLEVVARPQGVEGGAAEISDGAESTGDGATECLDGTLREYRPPGPIRVGWRVVFVADERGAEGLGGGEARQLTAGFLAGRVVLIAWTNAARLAG